MVGGEDLGKKNKESWDSEISNNATYDMYFSRLRDYALNMFEWEGLPETVNERFLNLTLLEQGKAVFFKDDMLGFMALPVAPGGIVNAYHEPTAWQAVSINYNKWLYPENSVLIWRSYSRQSILPMLRSYAYRLYKVEKTLDVNINSQKFPVVILADESQRLTMLNTMQQYDGNEPYIYGHKSGFDKEAVTVLETGAPFIADKLMEYKHNLWNEAMTFLGVGNAKQDKKERMVTDEVSANDEQIQVMRYNMLNALQDSCKEINKMFGLNVSVAFKLEKEQEREEAKQKAKEEEGEKRAWKTF